MSAETTKRATVSELARTLAERRSAATAYVNVKVSAQGALQPDVNVTPDTTQEDMDRMVGIAVKAVADLMAQSNGKPEKSDADKAAAKAAAIARSQA